ncbi:NusG domain II-containing protein, partial [candidate division KSB1 bacterium]
SQERELSVQWQLGTVDIRIQDKKVWVTKSSCPHKICMRMGKISKAGQMIVCVPNQVVITLRSCHKNLNLDVITR